MAEQADWIKVELNSEQDQLAHQIGNWRRDRAERLGLRSHGTGNWRQHDITGAQGEVAFALYRDVPLPRVSATEHDDRRRGYDIDGYEVRTPSRIHHGLNLKNKDHGKVFVMVLGHEAPMMWLVGWIEADQGFAVGHWRMDGVGDPSWCRVDPSHLHSLPEQNGYIRRGGTPWLVDPQTPFWCEDCGGMHPVIEHRECRAS